MTHSSLKTPLGKDALITERDLAARWKVSARTLQNARVSGRLLAFVKIGRSVRYRLEDVEAYELSLRRNHT